MEKFRFRKKELTKEDVNDSRQHIKPLQQMNPAEQAGFTTRQPLTLSEFNGFQTKQPGPEQTSYPTKLPQQRPEQSGYQSKQLGSDHTSYPTKQPQQRREQSGYQSKQLGPDHTSYSTKQLQQRPEQSVYQNKQLGPDKTSYPIKQPQQRPEQNGYLSKQFGSEQTSYRTEQMAPQQDGYHTMQLRQRPEQNDYQTMQMRQRYPAEQTKIKQHTNWSGVLQDLFGLDSPHTAESTHESTSSGVASDVTSVYPATPTMTTFKGDSAGSACSAKSNGSQDSGTKSASLSSSPKPGLTRQYMRGARMSPAPPVPNDPPPPLPAKHPLRIASASPLVEYGRVNSYPESPMNPSRGKRVRERRARASEQEMAQTNGETRSRSSSQVKGVQPQRNTTCYTCNAHDNRLADPHMYNEINGSFAETMREEHYIEAFGDIRFIESHVRQDIFTNQDRLSAVPSPVSPVPPGGYYYNRDTALSQHEQWLNELVTRDSRLHQKHMQQQQHQHQVQHYQQQLRLSQQHQLYPAVVRTSSPMRPENNPAQEIPSSHAHLHLPPGRGGDRTTPTGHAHNPSSRPGSAMNGGNPGARPPSGPRSVEQTEAHNPKQPYVFQTQAQVHLNSQAEDRPVRADSRMKLTNGHSETALNSSAVNPYKATGLVSGVKNLSISQTDISASKSYGIPSKGKKPMSRSSPFEFLPNDLLLKIFFHLPTDHLCRCAQVCRQWYNAVWDNPALWTSIVINNPNIDIDKALKYLTRRLSYNTPKICMILEKININFCSRLTDRGLQTAVKRCPELRYLDMQGCHLVTNEGVTEAVSRCVNLERLDVTGCHQVTCITLMDTVLAQSPSNHLERIYLRYLDMTDCPHIADQDLLVITSQCTQLLFFYLRRCPLITDVGISYIANNCSSLRELSMSDCLNITDLAMRELAKLRDNLRYLSVAKCEQVSDEGVISIAKNCSKLRYLNVRGCEAVSDIGLEFLARNCLRLRSLDIGKCDITDEGLYALSRYCPNLKKLGVKSCDGITDKGIVLVAYGCPSLQQLHVQDCCLSAEAYAMVRKYCKRAIIEHTNPSVL